MQLGEEFIDLTEYDDVIISDCRISDFEFHLAKAEYLCCTWD
jgi:hypothetical protein